MVKVRLLLFAVVVFLLASVYPVQQMLKNPGLSLVWLEFVGVGLFFLEVGGLPAALAMFICSFFRVEITPDSRLVYDPSNPYWRLMRRLWKKDWSDQISLCAAFWKTWMSFFVGIVLVFLASVLGYIFWKEGFGPALIGMGKVIVPIFGLIGGIGVIVYALAWLAKRDGFAGNIGTALIVVFAIATCVVLPIYLFMYGKDPRPLTAALWDYVRFAGITLACIGVFFGSALLISKASDTLLGQFVLAVKNKLCPLLFAKTAEAQTQS